MFFQTIEKYKMFALTNSESTLLDDCLYYMSPLNHKRPTSSLATTLICVAKILAIKKIEGSPLCAKISLHNYSMEKLAPSYKTFRRLFRRLILLF